MLAKDTGYEDDLLYRIGTEESPPYRRNFNFIADHIGLSKEVFERSVVRVIVQKHESFYSKATVVGKKIRKEIHLVPENRQQGEAGNQASHHV